MPLPIAPVGEELIVKKILLGERERRHFESLGIAVGAQLQLLSSEGAVIVRVKDGRLALNRDVAMKIIV
ncbi:MAG TPA: ferrous iron transport protein A [Candidatus Borkfalkia faecavium]|uniref:Ferrous iron transport protein A n=1 Tax=Candidatus Borkfalkia faecavium TaxID=2838508 RepID=A0A9D1VZ27_9FIRM|nr:ferrous iron transport protein A [Candidatus Borkfalkia faecavium]